MKAPKSSLLSVITSCIAAVVACSSAPASRSESDNAPPLTSLVRPARTQAPNAIQRYACARSVVGAGLAALIVGASDASALGRGAARGRGRRRSARGFGRGRPAAAQRLVELDQRDEGCADRLGLVHRRAEQRPLGVEHLEVGGHAAPIAQVGQLEHLALRLDARGLGATLLAELAVGHERVLDLAEGLEDRALVAVEGLALLRFRHLHAALVLSGVEDRLQDVPDDVPRLARAVEEAVEL